MGTGIDLKTFFQNTYSVNDQGLENIFDFINASIAVAASEKPKEFRKRRSRIVQALLMASPMDDTDQDCSISSSTNFSCESPLDEDLDDQCDGVTSAPSKPINLGAKEKGCGIIQSMAPFEGENKDRGKKFPRKIVTEDAKHKTDIRSANEGLSLVEVKFEETNLDIKKVKKRVQIGAKEKGCGIIQTAAACDEENKDSGKKFQRKIETEDAIDARSGNKGLGLDEVKFEATKRKFEERSLDIKKVKRKVQVLDFKDVPQSKPTVDENRIKRGGFKKPSFRKR